MPENTTAVAIASDPEIQKLHSEAVRLQEYAEARVIKSKEDLVPATNDLALIASLKKTFETRRREIIAPLQNQIKEINAAFESITLPILTADKVTRNKISEFQRAEDMRRQTAEEVNELRMTAAKKEAALNNGEISESVQLVDVPLEVPKKISTDLGSVGQRMVAKWETIDFSQVPDEYKMIDAAKVGKVVRAGLRNIPGIRIWEEPTLVVKTK